MKNVLIKISGDLLENEKVKAYIKENFAEDQVVIIPGGGTEVTKVLEAAGYKTRFVRGDRKHRDLRSKEIAEYVLHAQQNRILSLEMKHRVRFDSPYLYVGPVLCHFNGDKYLRFLAPGFDEAYCFTKVGRVKKFRKSIRVIKFE